MNKLVFGLLALGVGLGLGGLLTRNKSEPFKVFRGSELDNEKNVDRKVKRSDILEFNHISTIPKIDATAENKGKFSNTKQKNVKLKVKSLKVDVKRLIYISGAIDQSILEAADYVKLLDSQANSPIYILIDSPGGSVLDGARMVSAMQTAKSPIYTVCVRLCASMAFIIHQYGTKRYMLDRTILMSHFATAGLQGDVERMKSFVELLQKYVDRFSKEIAHRAGIPFDTYINLISKDLWMDEVDAESKGFSDGMVDVVPKTL